MAKQTPAMTPEDATAAIRDVREYRQNLTGRAAGLVWMVWGFALALFAASDLIGLAPMPETQGEGWAIAAVPWFVIAMPIAALAGGAIVTNAIWKSHALETGTRHRAWITWLALPAALGLMVLVGLSALAIALTSGQEGNTYVWLMPTLGAIGALALSILQSRRVKPWYGVVAAGFLLVVQFALPPMLGGSLNDKIITAVPSGMLAILTSFVAVGLIHYRRG